MPSQDQTFARHKREKAARKRARVRVAQEAEAKRRIANGARRANAVAGSQAAALVKARRADRAQAIADRKQARDDAANQRQRDALAAQRAHDAAARDMKSIQDGQTVAGAKAAQQTKVAKVHAAKQAKDAKAQADNTPLVEQEPREEGDVKKLFGFIDKNQWSEEKKTEIYTMLYDVQGAGNALFYEPSEEFDHDRKAFIVTTMGDLILAFATFAESFTPFRQRSDKNGQ